MNFDNQDKAYENFLAGPVLVKDDERLVEGPFGQGPTSIKVKADKIVVKTVSFIYTFLRY